MVEKGDNLWVNGSSGRRTNGDWLGCAAHEALHVELLLQGGLIKRGISFPKI